jgi:hypothetical protein
VRKISLIFGNSEKAPLIRADFSNDNAWDSLKAQVSAPVGDFQANIEFIEDRSFDGVEVRELAEALKDSRERSFVFLADLMSMTETGHPIICLDLFNGPGRTFRFISSQAWSVENNLSLGNMDFSDFLNAVGGGSVFVGFDK